MSGNRGVFRGASSALAIASMPLGSSWARSLDRRSVATQTTADMSLGQTRPPLVLVLAASSHINARADRIEPSP